MLEMSMYENTSMYISCCWQLPRCYLNRVTPYMYMKETRENSLFSNVFTLSCQINHFPKKITAQLDHTNDSFSLASHFTQWPNR